MRVTQRHGQENVTKIGGKIQRFLKMRECERDRPCVCAQSHRAASFRLVCTFVVIQRTCGLSGNNITSSDARDGLRSILGDPTAVQLSAPPQQQVFGSLKLILLIERLCAKH